MSEQTFEYRARGLRRGSCPCCGRLCALTFHHLIPKKLHRRKRFKADFSRDELARGIYVCRICHDGIHDRFDEMTLARHYGSLSHLLADEGLQRHFGWVGRQRIR